MALVSDCSGRCVFTMYKTGTQPVIFLFVSFAPRISLQTWSIRQLKRLTTFSMI